MAKAFQLTNKLVLNQCSRFKAFVSAKPLAFSVFKQQFTFSESMFEYVGGDIA